VFGILFKYYNNNHRFTAIIYRSIFVRRHLQLRTGGFCWCYRPHALAGGNKRNQIREKTLEFSTVLSTLSPCLETYTRYIHPSNGPFSGTTRVSRYQKGKTNLDFTEARDSEWQWHQLGHMHICTSLQTDNHASTPPLSFLQAGCPSCRPTNSVKALKAHAWRQCSIYLNTIIWEFV